jgi:hypothetical protein
VDERRRRFLAGFAKHESDRRPLVYLARAIGDLACAAERITEFERHWTPEAAAHISNWCEGAARAAITAAAQASARPIDDVLRDLETRIAQDQLTGETFPQQHVKNSPLLEAILDAFSHLGNAVSQAATNGEQAAAEDATFAATAILNALVAFVDDSDALSQSE